MAEIETTDVSDHIEPERMPCCPLCDNGILDWELCAVITAHGGKALAHADCVEEL